MSVLPFTYENHHIRAISIDGEPWFVLNDLAKALGFARSAAQLNDRIPDDLRQPYPIVDALGRTQVTTIVSEAGMYEVVIRSDKPDAAKFRRWITTEVLPAIRKTGSYSVAPALTEDQIIHQALTLSVARVEKLTARLAIVEPKADAFDRWLSSNVDYSVGHVANALSIAGAKDMGRNRLFRYLNRIGWAFLNDGQWSPYQTAIETGRLAVKLGSQLNTRTGQQFRTVTLRITPKGAAKLATLLGVMPEAVAETLTAHNESDAA